MNNWQNIVCTATATQAAEIAQIFDQAGASAVTEQAASPEQLLFDQHDNVQHLWESVQIIGLFPQGYETTELLVRLKANFGSSLHISVESLAERNWHEAWAARLEPQEFANQLWVCPKHKPIPPQAKHVIVLEPGMAFGTGTHPTTAMCLNWLTEVVTDETIGVLDFGCGSGILAIAAAKLGASEIAAVDIDPVALDVCRDNVAANAINDMTICEVTELDPRCYDIVVANILMEPLITERQRLVKMCRPGTKIALSGILDEQVDKVLAAYAGEFKLSHHASDGNWALLCGVLIG